MNRIYEDGGGLQYIECVCVPQLSCHSNKQPKRVTTQAWLSGWAHAELKDGKRVGAQKGGFEDALLDMKSPESDLKISSL